MIAGEEILVECRHMAAAAAEKRGKGLLKIRVMYLSAKWETCGCEILLWLRNIIQCIAKFEN